MQKQIVQFILSHEGWTTTIEMADHFEIQGETKAKRDQHMRVHLVKIRNKLRVVSLAVEGVRYLGYRIVRVQDVLTPDEAAVAGRIADRRFIVPNSMEAAYQEFVRAQATKSEIRSHFNFDWCDPRTLTNEIIKKAATT